MIQTVTGPISIEALGVVAPHEHLFIDLSIEALEPKTEQAQQLFHEPVNISNIGILRRNPFLVFDNLCLSDEKTALSELVFLQKANVQTLVDVTPVGVGRNLAALRRLSQSSGVQIIAGCGLYTNDTIPKEYSSMNIDALTDWLIREIKDGDQESGIRPGVIGEIGTSERIYPAEERSLLAAAYASRITGLPIYLHIYPWSHVALDALRLLMDNGVPSSRICVCHMDVYINYEFIYEVLATGSYVLFDNFGKEYYFEPVPGAFSNGPFETDRDRVRALIQLCSKGYSNRIMLATDICLKSLLHQYGGWGYDHVFTNIVPMLRGEGFSAFDIRKLINDNPVAFLSCLDVQ